MIALPAMDVEQQRFMALEGMHEWCQAAKEAISRYRAGVENAADIDFQKRITAMRRMRSEIHLFVIAAHKFLEYGDWAKDLNFLPATFMDPIEPHRESIERIRNKKEHVIEYFRGRGKFPGDWVSVEDGGSADASSVVGTKIGGRLDYIAVCDVMNAITVTLPDIYWPQRVDG